MRLDYITTALSPELKLYNFKNGINATVALSSKKLQFAGMLNGQKMIVPNLPLWLDKSIDAKFDTKAHYEIELGVARKRDSH